MVEAEPKSNFSGDHRSCILGLDLGATTLRIACLGRSGASLVRIATPERSAAAEILACNIRTMVSDSLVEGVGLSRAPGLNAIGVVERWPSRPEWEGAPLLEWIRTAAGKVPVSADDGVCAALWEHEQRSALEHTAVTACLSIGTGLGIGIINQGASLVIGEGADTLAHQRFGEINLTCKCGKQGCLQTVLSADGLEHAFMAGMTEAVEYAVGDFLRMLRNQYAVSRVVLTGGGVLKFERIALNNLFTRASNANRISLGISASPSMSAWGGAFLLVLGTMGGQNHLWRSRLADFVTGNGVQSVRTDSVPAEYVL